MIGTWVKDIGSEKQGDRDKEERDKVEQEKHEGESKGESKRGVTILLLPVCVDAPARLPIGVVTLEQRCPVKQEV